MGDQKQDQKRLTCQKHKVKERNVANNYENDFYYFLQKVGFLFEGRQLLGITMKIWYTLGKNPGNFYK